MTVMRPHRRIRRKPAPDTTPLPIPEERALHPVDATPADDAALRELASACEMRGDVGLRVDREPDFFALNRLEGERWQVGVVRGLAADSVAGCVAVSERRVYLNGTPRQTVYIGDLKVHPAHRGSPAADVLQRYARDACARIGGPDVPGLITILAGNAPMERRADGPRGLPVMRRFATIRSHAIPFVGRRLNDVAALQVQRARADDLEEMAALWLRVAPQRQLAPVHDAASLGAWIAAAPGLGLESYWVARHRGGRIAGFIAAWDQSAFKQMRVTSYSRRLRLVRAAFNLAASLSGATPLPRAGGELRCLTAFNCCVPGDEPGVLRALLLEVYAAKRGQGYSCINIGLDIRDPLTTALRGLLAQPTDIHAYITTPGGPYAGPALDTRPLHYETALV